ncbi:unnamed protein product, partial [Amoebophrya sp. A25]|eukprot:GSA25T00026818001.1
MVTSESCSSSSIVETDLSSQESMDHFAYRWPVGMSFACEDEDSSPEVQFGSSSTGVDQQLSWGTDYSAPSSSRGAGASTSVEANPSSCSARKRKSLRRSRRMTTTEDDMKSPQTSTSREQRGIKNRGRMSERTTAVGSSGSRTTAGRSCIDSMLRTTSTGSSVIMPGQIAAM